MRREALAGGPWRAAALCALGAACAVSLTRPRLHPHGDETDFVLAARDLLADTRYTPGWPMLLAPWSWSVGAMQVVAGVCGVALVAGIWWAAVKLGGWRAGAVAGVLVVLSPGVLESGRRLMSDGPAALFVVLALVAVLHGRDRLAGALLAFSGWVRIVQVAFCAALPRRAWPTAAAMIAVLVVWQLAVQGSVFGYDGSEAGFGWGYIAGRSSLEVVGETSPHTNVEFFLARMAGLESLVVGRLMPPGYVAPFVLFPAVVGFRRHWGRPARVAVGVVVLNLAVYLPYFMQSSRFVLPGGCVLVIFAAAAFGSGHPGEGAVTPGAVRTATGTPAALGPAEPSASFPC